MRRRTRISENQLSLPFGEGRGVSISYEDKEKAFWSLVSLSLLALTFYIYAINATAHHIAVREHLERQVAELGAELGTLEFASISLRNAVTMERAMELGFHEVRKPLFVSRLRKAVARSGEAEARTPNTSLTLNSTR